MSMEGKMIQSNSSCSIKQFWTFILERSDRVGPTKIVFPWTHTFQCADNLINQIYIYIAGPPAH